jgi:hypothetical protein
VKERPILFNADMVNAILAGLKTQTRRVIKDQPPEGCGLIDVGVYAPIVIDRKGEQQPGPDVFGAFSEDGDWGFKCPYGQPGDRLWVREAFRNRRVDNSPGDVVYRADHPGESNVPGSCGRSWKPSIHMPRWASRITLEIVSVRVERLKDISKIDAEAEGVQRHGDSWKDYLHPTDSHFALDARTSFATLWSSINGPGSWAANPWVWVVEFRRVEP